MVAIAFLIPLPIVVRDVARDQAFTTAQLTGRRSSRYSRSPRPRHDRARYRQHPGGRGGRLAVYLTAPGGTEARERPGDGGAGVALTRGGPGVGGGAAARGD